MRDSTMFNAHYAPRYLFDPLVNWRGQWATVRRTEMQDYSFKHNPIEYNTEVDSMAIQVVFNLPGKIHFDKAQLDKIAEYVGGVIDDRLDKKWKNILG